MLLEETDAVIWLARSELVEEADDETDDETDELELLGTDELLEELRLDDTEDDEEDEEDEMLLDEIEAVT